MKIQFYFNSYKYLPYELKLAARELSSLLGQEPVFQNNSLYVESLNEWKDYAHRTTYFREVVSDDGTRVIPLQATLESSARRKKPVLPDVASAPIRELFYADVLLEQPENERSQPSHRQSTRYSAHGLHEYRGKFNPQIVRAIGNLIGLKPGDWVLDPFCGSGTTLLEAAHVGWNAISIDINPLGTLITRAKIAAMNVPSEKLRIYSKALSQRLSEHFRNVSFEQTFSEDQIHLIGGEDWQTHLPNLDYLRSWFKESVLVQLAIILNEISRIPIEEIQLIFRVILSDILRNVSLQDPADLRIRRRKSPPENAPAIPIFLNALTSKIETIFNARQYLPEIMTRQEALLGDSRYCSSVVRAYSGISQSHQFDGAITSPPYATALPYIDTQRLSLVLLGLINPDEIRATEKSLTGNREITPQERQKIEAAIEANADQLPLECILLCRKLKESLDNDQDGFRRQNVPALIYQYLVDMSLMFKNIFPLLKTNAPFALVVGPNQTCLGGQTFVIDTPRLLTLLAEHNDFVLQETLDLNTYQRFDVHQDNSIRSETLVILRKVNNAH